MRDLGDIRTHEVFESLCHELLRSEYPDYQPVAGEGGDEGIDGFRDDRTVLYQFKFSNNRLRPADYLKDLDRVVSRPGLREWVLVIPRNPTSKLLALEDEKERQYHLDITILGCTALKTLLDKHAAIRERYFPQVAKEATVRGLYKHVASRVDMRRLENEIRANPKRQIIHAARR